MLYKGNITSFFSLLLYALSSHTIQTKQQTESDEDCASKMRERERERWEGKRCSYVFNLNIKLDLCWMAA